MKVKIWCDGAAQPNPGPAGAGYVVVGGVNLLRSDPLGISTNNRAEYTAVRNALRAAANKGATSAVVRIDSTVVFRQLTGTAQTKDADLIRLKEEVKAQITRYSGQVRFYRIDRELNRVADELAKNGALASKG